MSYSLDPVLGQLFIRQTLSVHSVFTLTSTQTTWSKTQLTCVIFIAGYPFLEAVSRSCALELLHATFVGHVEVAMSIYPDPMNE